MSTSAEVPNIVALVSVGRHPLTGRLRRAPLDARAVELGLQLSGARLQLLHAGDPGCDALRDYLGMGAPELQVLRTRPRDDVVLPLAQALRTRQPSLILAGMRAENDEDSGMLPYLLARALDLPLAANVVDARIDAHGIATVLLALPRGRRREIEVATPCMLVVGAGGPSPRPVAFGMTRRGRIVDLDAVASPDARRHGWHETPARPRGKRLRVLPAGSAAERLQAATAVASSGGAAVHPASPAEAAEIILEFLRRSGVRQ